MKKLKVVGIKKGWIRKKVRKVVAEIWVENGRVIVKAKDPVVGDLWQKEIEREVKIGAFRIGKHKLIEDKDGRLLEHHAIESPRKLSDPDFLKAVRGALWFWEGKKMGAYEIYETISEVVEE